MSGTILEQIVLENEPEVRQYADLGTILQLNVLKIKAYAQCPGHQKND